MRDLVPIVGTLREYDRSWLTGDLFAAITVWAIVIPESMAYASIAGLPPQTGLYASMVPLVLYALLGSSRRMTVGPSAAVAALSFATVAAFAPPGSPEFVSMSLLLALMVGVVLIISSVLRLGVIADFLSEPVLKGFIVGVAMTIALGQLGKVFGIHAEGEGFFEEAWDLIRQLPDFHLETLILGVGCLVALFVLDRLMPRVPAAIVVVVGAIVAVNALDLIEKGVLVAGEIPSGLPSFAVPSMSVDAVSALLPGAIGIAIVVFGESMALSKTFGSKHRERVDADQEMLALGTGNAAGGFFGGFVTAGSNSRTAAADGAGQETQVSSLLVAVLVAITLLFLTGLFADLPEAALGAIVVHAVLGLIRFHPIRVLWARNRLDFWAAATTLFGVLVLDVLAGLMIGVLVSLGGLMRRAIRPRVVWLSPDPDTGEYTESDERPQPDEVGVVRFGAELFFANVGTLRDAMMSLVVDGGPAAIVLDGEAITDIDTTAEDELKKLDVELAEEGVRLVFARLHQNVASSLEMAGVEVESRSYRRIASAVDAVTDHRG
jgi:high affinity sulfate transporter 1